MELYHYEKYLIKIKKEKISKWKRGKQQQSLQLECVQQLTDILNIHPNFEACFL